MNSPSQIPGTNISGILPEKLQQDLLVLENKFKSGEINGTELQTRNIIIDELKKRTTFIDSLAQKHNKLDADWERLDTTGRKTEQEEITKEMNNISTILNLLGYNSEGRALKNPEVQAKVSAKVAQLTFPGFEHTGKKGKRKRK